MLLGLLLLVSAPSWRYHSYNRTWVYGVDRGRFVSLGSVKLKDGRFMAGGKGYGTFGAAKMVVEEGSR